MVTPHDKTSPKVLTPPTGDVQITYSRLPELFFSPVPKTSFTAPSLFKLNTALAREIGLEPDELMSPNGLKILTGATTLSGEKPIAMAYAGHQFGHYSRLLGDGRAMMIGEPVGAAGHRHDLHLKGSGRTPFSRGGDGKATLGSTIREYVVSEAMAALGVPTTRSLAIVLTGEQIMRNGMLPGAVLARTARSHIRVGTFQYAFANGTLDDLRALADFAIQRLYPDIHTEGPQRYQDFLIAVAVSQAELISKWLSLGFIHGVMNTDNMSIAGETIDYGPCAFMDTFDPGKVFSSIDHQGRYAWNRQAEIGQWNLTQLAQSVFPLLGKTEDDQVAAAHDALSRYVEAFQASFRTEMANKLGLSAEHDKLPDFVNETFKAMAEGSVDFTRFFNALSRSVTAGSDEPVLGVFQSKTIGKDWLGNWQKLRQDTLPKEQSIDKIQRSNPVRIPRNHQVERAITDGEAGNGSTMENLLNALQYPYAEDDKFSDYEKPPEANEIVTQTFCGT